MTALAVRPLLSVAAASIALGSVALAGAPAAYAAPGDNGDIKVHREGTAEPNQSNHPRVCRFHFAAFNFDDLLSVHWEIVPENKVSPVKEGDIAINAEGDGFTADMELPDGRYRLEWSWVGQLGAKKSKNFTVNCLGDVTNPPPNGGGENGGNGNGGNGSTASPSATAPPPNNNGGNGGGSNGGGNGGNGGNGSSGGSGWNGGNSGTETGNSGTETGGNGTTQKPWHKPPQGPVGAGGGGAADATPSDDGSAFGVGAALAAGLAGTAGLILVRRNRRRTHGES